MGEKEFIIAIIEDEEFITSELSSKELKKGKDKAPLTPQYIKI